MLLAQQDPKQATLSCVMNGPSFCKHMSSAVANLLRVGFLKKPREETVAAYAGSTTRSCGMGEWWVEMHPLHKKSVERCIQVCNPGSSYFHDEKDG